MPLSLPLQPANSLVFRVIPPKELVAQILQAVGLASADLTDTRWFRKEELRLEGAEEWLSELESYYYPCKARRFLYGRPLQESIITILRQIVVVHGGRLDAMEKKQGGERDTLYRVVMAAATAAPTSFTLVFD